MKAIILAAGKSSRLYPLTLEKPKCLLELEPGKTIIEHQIKIINQCGINKIIVVVGYQKEKIKDVLKDTVYYREFLDFARYNNLHTLYSIKNDLNEDTLILFSDVLFGKKLLKKCLDSDKDFCLLIHNKNILLETMRIQIKDNCIVNIGSHIPIEEGDGNFIGVAKFSRKGINILVTEMKKMISNTKHHNDYYTLPLINIAKKHKVGYELVEDEPWIEIDFLNDYNKAKNEIYELVK